MARLTDKQIMSIFNLTKNPDFDDFMLYVEEIHSESISACVSKNDEIEIRRAQGAVKKMDEIIGAVRDSHKNLQRLKAQREAKANVVAGQNS